MMALYQSDLLNDLHDRGFLYQCTNMETLDAHLAAGKTVSVYAGFDCTADSLHVGNLMTLMLLRRFAQAGHRVIPLIGGATTMVGDPTGKDESRPAIDGPTLRQNVGGIRQSIHRVIPAGDNVQIVNNFDWIGNIHWLSLLGEIGRAVSINRMLTLDAVRTRLDREGGHLNYLEFNYPVMQAVDFLTLARDHAPLIQIGGSDQWGNITMGTDLISRLEPNLSAWGLTHPLLTAPDGKKMGKSVKGAVWLNPDKLNDFEFWQYWRNVPDGMVGRLLKLYTDLRPDMVDSLVEQHQGAGINALKATLATQVTLLVRGADAVTTATKAAEVFSEGTVTQGLEEYHLRTVGSFITHAGAEPAATVTWVEVAVSCGLCGSRSDARRLIAQKGLHLNNTPLEADRPVAAGDFSDGTALLSKGKKTHRAIRLDAIPG